MPRSALTMTTSVRLHRRTCAFERQDVGDHDNYCARHVVAAGVDEVQYIEPYPKSQALKLHDDSIRVDASDFMPPSANGKQVLFRPFRGVAPRMYARAFLKDRDLKDDTTGVMKLGEPEWGSTFDLTRVSYAEMEALLSRTGGDGG